METMKMTDKFLNSFCKEFQSIWLVRLCDLSMEVYTANMDKSIPNSVEQAKSTNDYEVNRHWYIDNFVVKFHRKRLYESTEVQNVLKRTQNGEPYYIEYGREVDGDFNFNQLCYDILLDEDGKPEYMILGFRNIDVRNRADFDELTGVLTRQSFFDKASQMVNNNPEKDYDIVITDIVDFKKVNETYGAETADEILKWTGNYMVTGITDTLYVGRYGGDQFVMIGAHEVISKYILGDGLHKFDEAEKNNGLPSVVTKFGVYECIDHDKSIMSNCDKAHVALNSIKGHYQKKIAYYDDEIKNALEKQRRIENSMYESLENGDFKVYYQPKHDAVSGKLVGAEALIRWIHPEYGFMSPGDFIPLFEKNGFVVENDRFVWKRTCENLKRWQDKGIKTVPISINASKLTIEKEDLLKSIQVPVDANGISPKQLHIEITETLMTDNVDELIKKLTALRTIGYQIELDDFGAGYSSINILSTLPLDIIKLDMSFMQQFGDEKRAKVLAASINLAKELGYKTVSEGVELPEQNDLLGILGVDIIQGFLYSKPLSEEAFENYLVANQ